jgi:methylated-DNA-protein-cysteine methyltransferase-like protein
MFLNDMKTTPLTEKNKDFFDLVHEVVKLIPKGRVTTYGAIASYLGSARSSRMVGWAMNASHKIEGIPAHRVVNRIGLLTGKMNFETPTLMEERLKQEGINVINNQIEGFKQLFWDPTIELNIH